MQMRMCDPRRKRRSVCSVPQRKDRRMASGQRDRVRNARTVQPAPATAYTPQQPHPAWTIALACSIISLGTLLLYVGIAFGWVRAGFETGLFLAGLAVMGGAASSLLGLGAAFFV